MNKTKKKSLLDVGTNKYLMFDDALTEEKKGFVLTMNPAERSQKPVLLPDQRWERGSISGDSFTGDSRHSRSEHIEAENLVIDVTWAKLDRPGPTCTRRRPDSSATSSICSACSFRPGRSR